MNKTTVDTSRVRLRTLATDQRVRVVDARSPNNTNAPITINALGTVRRVRSDGSAWVALERSKVEAVHPFPADDSRGAQVLAYPEDCEAPTETRAGGNRRERRAGKVEAAKAAQDADAATPTLATFGKDHWSTFAYIETRYVDHGGVPQKEHMRCNNGRHPLQAHGGGDASAHPTRLKDAVVIHNHDDWNCLDDCEREGLLTNVGSALFPRFVLSTLGHEIAKQLRLHLGSGGSFGDFVPKT